jgi:hypothetical protein
MGTQQRSSPHTIEVVDKIGNGLIGRAYYAKAWYSNIRKSIGVGKEAPVPAQLDWDLWQGPRRASLTRTMCSRITGTGSRSGAPARRSTTARMKWMFAAGRSASIIPSAFPLPADAITSKTTGSSTTRCSPALNTRQAHRLGRKMLPGHEVLRPRPRLLHHGNHRLGDRRPRRLRGLRSQGQQDPKSKPERPPTPRTRWAATP